MKHDTALPAEQLSQPSDRPGESTAPRVAVSEHMSSGRRFDLPEAVAEISGLLANRPMTANGRTISCVLPANAVIRLLEAISEDHPQA